MANGRRKEIHEHLTEEDLDEMLRETDDPEMVRRLGFVKNLYKGDTITEAADRQGMSQPTGVRWTERWNAGGIEGLKPDYDGGRPPKLDGDERAQLRTQLKETGPRTTREIRHLINAEFGVTYHPNYIYKLLRELGVHNGEPRPRRPERPEIADETLANRGDDALDNTEGDEP